MRSFGSPDHFAIPERIQIIIRGLFWWGNDQYLKKNLDTESKTVTFIQVVYQCWKQQKKIFLKFSFSEQRSWYSQLLDTLHVIFVNVIK